MSTSITHRSGTLLRASPPTILPRLIEGRSKSSELCRANGSDSILRKTSIALRTALSPSQGVAPWAAVPPTSSRSARTPLASIPMCRSVGSPVIAKSPTKPLSTRWSEPRSELSSDSSSPTIPSRTRALHVVRAAPNQPIAGGLRHELPGVPRHYVDMPMQNHGRGIRGPNFGHDHGQPPNLIAPSLDPPSFQPPLNKPSGLGNRIWLAGLEADQPLSKDDELVAHSGQPPTPRIPWFLLHAWRLEGTTTSKVGGTPPSRGSFCTHSV